MNQHLGLSGQYRFEIKRPDGSVQDTGWFKNIILDSGLDYLGTGEGSYFSQGIVSCLVLGTGSSAPLASQTSLDNPAAAVVQQNPMQIEIDQTAPYTKHMTYSFTFPQGGAVGNFSEVGVGFQDPTDQQTTNIVPQNVKLFSRSLIVDANGLATTVSVTALDQVTVYYKLSVSFNIQETTGSMVIGGTTYNYVCKPYHVLATDVGQGFGQIARTWYTNNENIAVPYISVGNTWTINPATMDAGIDQDFQWDGQSMIYQGTSGGTLQTVSPYVSGTHVATTSFSWPINYGNEIGGISGFAITISQINGTPLARYQIRLDTPIPKDNTKTLSITFRTSWGRQ